MSSQHYLKTIESRDAQITSLSGQLHIGGFIEAPFSTESVKQFLSETNRILRDREERARQEKVRKLTKYFSSTFLKYFSLVCSSVSFRRMRSYKSRQMSSVLT